METFLYMLLVIFIVFGLSFALINIRHIFTGKEFRGTCAQNNAKLKNEVGECTVCGANTAENCEMPEVEGNKA